MYIPIRLLLYGTVFITGFGVLVLEVTAVRVLSPYFGSSLFVLSSVLTVILGALSTGYYFGGKISDRFPHHSPLFFLITYSGISVLVTQILSLIILPAISPSFSQVSGPLIFSFVLFFLPSILLGIVSPYVIKLQSLHTDKDTIGSVVGATFFWGTLGSILGSLASGFLLIPLIGVSSSIIATGVGLYLLGIVGELLLPKTPTMPILFNQKKHLLSATILFIALLVFLNIEKHQTKTEEKLLFSYDGLYSHVAVYEDEILGRTVHKLQRDLNSSSASYVESDELIYSYTQFAEFYPMLQEKTERYLVLGGGAYSIPRTLVAKNPDLLVDVVEIEPSLYDVAKKYFGLPETNRIKNIVLDARVYLKQSDTLYDVIFLDVFGTDLSLPAHLATQEFFNEIKKDLQPEGVLIINYIGSVPTEATSLTGSLTKTIHSVFPNTKIYAVRTKNPGKTQNIVFVARNGFELINLDGATVHHSTGKTAKVVDMEIIPAELDIENELLFTDDHAPVEYLMLREY